MKKIIKKLLPQRIKNLLIKYKDQLSLKKAYNLDKKRFSKSAFGMAKDLNVENLEAKIIFHYHSIEKGLSNTNFRYGFGERAYTQLIKTMNEFVQKGFNTESIAFQTGLSVLSEYVLKHKDTNINTDFIENSIKRLSNTNPINELGGIYTLHSNEVIENSRANYEILALNRFSVRDFDSKPIDINLINKALNIAKKAPSVCNRQPWHNHVIRDKSLIKLTLDIQGGFTGHGNNIDTLILITSNNNYLSNYTERNQGFTDCGMYAMSLIHSLQYLGLATCALNANLTINNDFKVRNILSIPENQNLVMFIAVGNYDKVFMVPKSPRFDIETKTTYH